MRDWSERLREHSAPWVVSLLLHAGIFLLIRGWAMAPLVPYGEGAVEVMLVDGLPRGGGASGAETTGRGESEGGGGASTAARAKIRLKEGANSRPSSSRMKHPVPTTSTPSDLAKAEPIDGPRALPQPLETSDTEFSDPVSLDDAQGDKRLGLNSASAQVDPARQEKAVVADGSQRPGGGVGSRDGPRSGIGEGDKVHPRGTALGEGSGLGTGTGLGPSVGQGWGGDWRQVLLERIERAKRYPPQARRWGMEGTTEVQFRITGDGSVEAVTVVKSSGFAILDLASVETIKRAAPLPVVIGTIRIPISYRLRDAR